MLDTNEVNLTKETIAQLGIQLSNRKVNAQIAPNARVFEYPGVENIYIMESDLYGNIMPKGSCFLAFEGRSGLIGKHITIEKLKNSSVDDIKKIVEDNHSG